jgi:hypothetical protein
MLTSGKPVRVYEHRARSSQRRCVTGRAGFWPAASTRSSASRCWRRCPAIYTIIPQQHSDTTAVGSTVSPLPLAQSIDPTPCFQQGFDLPPAKSACKNFPAAASDDCRRDWQWGGPACWGAGPSGVERHSTHRRTDQQADSGARDAQRTAHPMFAKWQACAE